MARDTTSGYYALRWQILKRDNFTCQTCGQYAPNVKLEVDHIITIRDGGDDSLDNLRTTCYACNRGREGLRISEKCGKLKPKDFTMKRVRVPVLQDKIAEALTQGPMLITEIASQIKANPESVKVTLYRYKNRFTKSTTENKKWVVLEIK